jgi:hypothetical protein
VGTIPGSNQSGGREVKQVTLTVKFKLSNKDAKVLQAYPERIKDGAENTIVKTILHHEGARSLLEAMAKAERFEKFTVVTELTVQEVK